MDIEKAIEEMMEDPKIQAILEDLGSDYDKDGIAYWDKNETNY